MSDTSLQRYGVADDFEPAMKRYFETLEGSETGCSLDSRYAVTRVFRKLCCNLIPIRSTELTKIGYGIYPSLFAFQQSCITNCVVVFDDSLARVIALYDIQEGEKLLV